MKLLDTLMAVDTSTISHDKIIYDQEPVRLFKSDFLEFLRT